MNSLVKAKLSARQFVFNRLCAKNAQAAPKRSSSGEGVRFPCISARLGDASVMEGSLTRGYLAIGLVALVPRAFLNTHALAGGSPPFAVFAFAIALLLCLLRPVQLVCQRHPSPLKQLGADVRRHWPWLLTVAFMLLALSVTLDTASHFKMLIPTVRPFYADPFLIRLDQALFFGADAWQVTHAILGPLSTEAIDLVYGFWHIVQIGLAVFIVLTTDRRFQVRAALSFQLAWLVLGSALATLFSSVGPRFYDVFYHSQHFAALMPKLSPATHSATAAQYLLATRGTDSIGSGISAMPSLHVGIAVLVALVVRDRWPRWQAFAWAYATVIYVGSIQLGWHYATDGIVAGLCTVAVWKACGWFVRQSAAAADYEGAASQPLLPRALRRRQRL